MRSQLVDHALACVYVVCSVGLFLCVGRVCEPANLTDPHLESHRRRKQMWCSCIVSVVMLQALVVSIMVAIVAPFATWHLQLSRQVKRFLLCCSVLSVLRVCCKCVAVCCKCVASVLQVCCRVFIIVAIVTP